MALIITKHAYCKYRCLLIYSNMVLNFPSLLFVGFVKISTAFFIGTAMNIAD